jgi:hypothetical protein
VVFTLDHDSGLTWNWMTEFRLNTGAGPGGDVSLPNGWHANGSNVVVTAGASNYWAFSRWTGDVPAGHVTDNPLTLTMDGPRNIQAEFYRTAADISGTVSYSGAQTGLIWVVATADETLVVTDATTWVATYSTSMETPGPYTLSNVFTNVTYWIKAYRDMNGDLTNEAWEALGLYVVNPLFVTSNVVAIDMELTGQASLVITSQPETHGTPEPDGYGSHYLVEGTRVTNTVASPVPGATGVRYTCVGWSGTGDVPVSGTDTSVVFTLDHDSGLTWNWVTEYRLDMGAGAGGDVSILDDWHANGSRVVVTASASNHWAFSRWTGDVPDGHEMDNPIDLTMDQPRAITAVFTQITVLVSGTVNYAGQQQGPIRVIATRLPDSWMAESFTDLVSTATFTIYIPARVAVWMEAFCDSNTNGVKEYWEASGLYPSNPLYLEAAQSGVGIVLSDPDTDGDGILDWVEVKNGTDPFANDGALDSDGDGVSNLLEYSNGTNPNQCDSDGDGVMDGQDAAASASIDSDGDGMPDDWEWHWFGHLNQDETTNYDGDDLSDLGEYKAGRDPIHGNQSDGSNSCGLTRFLPRE